MVLRALNYSVIAGVGFWLLLGLFVMFITGGHGDPMDKHKPLLSHQLLIGLASVSLSVLMFTVVGLVSVGILKTFEFVKRIISFP